MATVTSAQYKIGTYTYGYVSVDYSGTSATAYLHYVRTNTYSGEEHDTTAWTFTFGGQTTSSHDKTSVSGKADNVVAHVSFTISLAGGTYSGSSSSSVFKFNGSVTIPAQYVAAKISTASFDNASLSNPTITFSTGTLVNKVNVWIEPNPSGTHLAVRENITNNGSYTWTLTSAERQAIIEQAGSAVKTCTCRVGLYSYDSNNNATSSSKDITLTLNNDTGVTVNSSVDSESAYATVKALTGNTKNYVPRYSKAVISGTAHASTGATLTLIELINTNSNTVIDSSTPSGYSANYSFTKDKITTSAGAWGIRVTDTRGYTNTVSTGVTVLGYVPISENSANIGRTTSSGSTVDIRSLLLYYWKQNFGATDNTLTVTWAWKETGGSYSSAYNLVTTSNSRLVPSQSSYTVDYDANTNIATITANPLTNGSTSNLFNYQKTYVIKIIATDKLSTWTKEYNIGIGIPNFSVFANTIMINGIPIFDLIYPVGSIYLTLANVNPGQKFGGTWTRIGVGRTLISAGGGTNPVGDANTVNTWGSWDSTGQTSLFPAGERGGETTHTLTESELPEIDSGSISWHGQEHGTHIYNLNPGTGGTTRWYGTKVSGQYQTTGATSGAYSYSFVGFKFGGGGSHRNVEPYLAVYMWQRTA